MVRALGTILVMIGAVMILSWLFIAPEPVAVDHTGIVVGKYSQGFWDTHDLGTPNKYFLVAEESEGARSTVEVDQGTYVTTDEGDTFIWTTYDHPAREPPWVDLVILGVPLFFFGLYFSMIPRGGWF